MSKTIRTLLLFVTIIVACLGLITLIGPSGPLSQGRPKQLAVSEIYQRVDSNSIAEATWSGTTLEGELRDHTKFVAEVPDANSSAGQDLSQKLRAGGVKVTLKSQGMGPNLPSIISMLAFPIIFFVIFYFFFLRPQMMGGNQALNFGRSRAKRAGETNIKVTFDDVAGIEEAKQELFEIVDFLKNTKKYTALGAKIPKGILLTGPPGVGKTHLARAIAGEAGVPFFHISGSDFVEMFVGVGAARVRDLFETAKAHRPSLIFIDEIDAVGRQRGAGLGGGHDEREQTLNQLLVEMDGFDPNSGVILIAATNRPDVLDPAILRPGRFDRQIVVDPPDAEGREQILRIHAKNKPLDASIDLGVLGRRTPGFTGADLANMLNEGALLAARRGHSRISQDDLDEALDRVIAGPQKRSRVIDEREREQIAYHEAGHAVVGELLTKTDRVHKVTILPRGRSLGATWQLPDKDKYLVSKDELLEDITALLGGRVAEELAYNDMTTGASNDLERVTAIARAMVCNYGMSEKLGTLALGRSSHNPFLGRDFNEERNYSEDIARQIDEEIRSIVDTCYRDCKEILIQNREKLDAVVKALLERETLGREEFLAVLNGEPMPEAKVKADFPSPVAEPRETESQSKPIVPPRFEPGPA
ncbi:MAG: ATP-dependent zinc metalloprotease FtsH [Armatimonadetes bacterium]|nr:ATP-dependent zinc metalloprotease FtsH [Armatimonadota bacterium]